MKYTVEILELKAKTMLQKIEKLCDTYVMLLRKKDCKEIAALKVIKEQYLKAYQELIEKKQYDKYKEVEDVVVAEIAKIQLNLDERIYDNAENCQEMIMSYIQEIRESNSYQNYQNMKKELHYVELLKELLELHSPYLSQNEENKLVYEVTRLKFDVLFRKQVEELIYQNGNVNHNLGQYNGEVEKQVFKEVLQEKMDFIKSMYINSNPKEYAKNDEVFNVSVEQILKESRLVERFIIFDMYARPHEYVPLLKAKIFNAHLCNIGNNPFEQEIYLTEKQLFLLGYWNYHRNVDNDGLKTNKVNYSLLLSILKQIITDENVSIIECQKLYGRFGFECNPIILDHDVGQQCVKMIFDRVKRDKNFVKHLNEFKPDKRNQDKRNQEKKNQEKRYCKLDFEGLTYEFYHKKDNPWYFKLDQILKQREQQGKGFVPKRKLIKNGNDLQQKKISTKTELLKDETYSQEEEERIRKEKNLLTKEQRRYLTSGIRPQEEESWLIKEQRRCLTSGIRPQEEEKKVSIEEKYLEKGIYIRGKKKKQKSRFLQRRESLKGEKYLQGERKKYKNRFLQRRESLKYNTYLQQKKEKIRKEGSIITDIDLLILLSQEHESFYAKEREWIRKLKSENEKLTLEENKNLLLTINNIYRRAKIKDDAREIVPLEEMTHENSGQVSLTKVASTTRAYSEIVSTAFVGDTICRTRYRNENQLGTLWERYQEEFRDLRIEVIQHSKYYKDKPVFELWINLDDISDLPIDPQKVKFLTKEELQEIMKYKEGDGR